MSLTISLSLLFSPQLSTPHSPPGPWLHSPPVQVTPLTTGGVSELPEWTLCTVPSHQRQQMPQDTSFTPSISFPSTPQPLRAPVTALRPWVSCSGAKATFSPCAIKQIFKILVHECTSNYRWIPFLLPACPSAAAGSPSSLPEDSEGNSETQLQERSHSQEAGEGTKLDACALFNSTFWQKRKPQV